MHDALFAADELDDAALQRIAAQVGLDRKRFATDLVSPAALAAVTADIQDGTAAGVEGTPSIFVNGRLADDTDQVQTMVREALTDLGRPLPPPLSGDDLDVSAANGPSEGAR
jgi:predicted DsbA family dithiol-disulfide isomerase